MLEANRERTDSLLADDDLTLDVGGWASPWERADWVIDMMPYSTRGLYGSSDPALERFSAETILVVAERASEIRQAGKGDTHLFAKSDSPAKR